MGDEYERITPNVSQLPAPPPLSRPVQPVQPIQNYPLPPPPPPLQNYPSPMRQMQTPSPAQVAFNQLLESHQPGTGKRLSK
ncbi:unnamed protein product [Haemonchus placei]|uniref:Uncharacterized protein n=1 Tax=Haemonchus placei TaxID=6290 RepID=A0A0N4WC68_HAEPC|nr:unnamed protein product [Haemonchus placei]